MLANVFGKTIRDHWLGWTIAVVSLNLMLLLAMAVYREIDLTVFSTLPEVYLSLLGLGEVLNLGGFAIAAVHGFYGALTLAAMALVMGAFSIAGEERNRTIGILLANPKSRTHVLVSKAGSLVLLTGLSVLAMWGVVYPIAAMLNVDIGRMDVEAISLHLFVNTLFYGSLAMFIGAWTGKQNTASGATTAVMILSFVAVGLLPLVQGWADVVKVFPWYYFNSSEPLRNGVHWGHLGVLLLATAVFACLALIGVNRRDLGSQPSTVSFVGRLRVYALSRSKRLFGGLTGTARASSIWLKTVSEHQVLLVITGATMFFLMGILEGAFYKVIPQETLTAFKDMPEVLFAVAGGGDMSTPEGFYQLETFGMMAPAAVMVATIAIGAGALAGEESRRTMGLLLANPITRSKIVLEKSWAMVLCACVIGLATFFGVALGSVFADLGMDIGNIAATCLLQTLVGLAFGAFALSLSAGTGRGKLAVFVTIGIALITHLLNGFASWPRMPWYLSDVIQWLPFHYYLGNDPLNNGMDWGHGAILTGLVIALIALSVVLFQRRDIRQIG